MISIMTTTMFFASIGLAVSMSVSGNKPLPNTIEEPVAASFLRYKKAVECWAGVNPGASATNLSAATLKATIDAQGKACLNAAYNGAAGIGSTVTPTMVYVYMTPTTIRGVASPAERINSYFGKTASGGVVSAPAGGSGTISNLAGTVYSNVLNLPAGSVMYQTVR